MAHAGGVGQENHRGNPVRGRERVGGRSSRPYICLTEAGRRLVEALTQIGAALAPMPTLLTPPTLEVPTQRGLIDLSEPNH